MEDGKAKVNIVSINPETFNVASAIKIGKRTIIKKNKKFKKAGVDFEFKVE